MSRKTRSETLFEMFCDRHGIRCEPIPTQAKEGKRTPDYDLYIGGQRIVTEIKQIDPNDADKAIMRKNEQGETVVQDVGPAGKRVRNQIDSAKEQIRLRARGKYPSMLVLFNNLSHTLFDPISGYQIRVAMYGLEANVLWVPEAMEQRIYLIDKKFGPKRKMTPDTNTSISAIAALRQNTENKLSLVVCHRSITG